jgi:uncharacterized protein (DUF2062 family)
MQKFWQKIKVFFMHFFTLKDTRHHIAGGFALGIFAGIVPGEGLATTLVLAKIFRLNKTSATAGVLATNMWGTLAVLPLVAPVGSFLFGTSPDYLFNQFYHTYHLGIRFFLSKVIFFDLALPLIVGFIVIAGAISFLFYLFLYLFLKYKKIAY